MKNATLISVHTALFIGARKDVFLSELELPVVIRRLICIGVRLIVTLVEDFILISLMLARPFHHLSTNC